MASEMLLAKASRPTRYRLSLSYLSACISRDRDSSTLPFALSFLLLLLLLLVLFRPLLFFFPFFRLLSSIVLSFKTLQIVFLDATTHFVFQKRFSILFRPGGLFSPRLYAGLNDSDLPILTVKNRFDKMVKW